MNIRNILILQILFIASYGCSSIPKLPIITEEEAFKYEKKYLTEYESLKSNSLDQNSIKWVQAANKKIPCKVFVGFSKKEDRTLDDNYQIYWDGGCKNGYANGLGREFERGTVLNVNALAIYKGEEEEPKYFVQKYRLDNRTIEGDLNNGYYVETTINEDNFDFSINYNYGFFGSTEIPYRLSVVNSPFNDDIIYSKQYPNFSYVFYDFSNNEFAEQKYNAGMVYKGNLNGFVFSVPKNGAVASAELNNGTIIRRVQLPSKFFTRATSIQNEIRDSALKALNAQKKALRVKRQYMSKVCKESVSVDFMDNNEYKYICNDASELKIKIEEKLVKIDELKRQKREQNHQYKLFLAKQSQERRNAKALEDVNQSLKRLGRDIKNNTSKTTYTNCNGTYGGVNCTSTTY